MTDNETPKKISIKEALAGSNKRLKSLSESFQNDSRVILSLVLDKSQSWLLAHPEENLSPEQNSQFDKYLSELENGTPLPYLIGEWDFFRLKFKVTPDTIIPRPETELLVETALNWLKSHQDKNNLIEIGTGTGCIPISIAVNDTKVQITAVDISHAALKIAKENAHSHNVQNRISFLISDLFDKVENKYNLICSNPPYVSAQTLHDLGIFEKEPTIALDGGEDGLRIIEKILSSASAYLLPYGLILIEIESSQGEDVQKLASQHFPSADIHVKKDLAGHDRLLVIQT